MADQMPLVDGARLWARLMEIAKIGGTPKGGVCRLAMTDTDKAGRDLFAAWCEEAGLTIEFDVIGNMFARRAGTDPLKPPIMFGSHLDSQPTGGKFDGVYGVLAGLEVINTLNDNDIETIAPLEIVAWTNEEGARFPPAMMGSGVFAGAIPLEEALARTDADGISLGAELTRLGYAGSQMPGSRKVGGYLEAHIEQGPVLEAENRDIGVVTNVSGIRWYDVTVVGKEAHAGPFPMSMRQDPVQAAVRLIDRLYAAVGAVDDEARMTVGQISAKPGSRNTVPGSVTFTVDIRHPEADKMTVIDQTLRELAADAGNCQAHVDELWYSPPVDFDDACIRSVRDAAAGLGYSSRDMSSGAGHDAVYLARMAPTGMIFVPCEDGLSHNEAEHAEPEALEKGTNILLRAVINLAGGSGG